MNRNFVFLLLLIVTLMPMLDAATEDINCDNWRDCLKPCKDETGCPNSKCEEGNCLCYGCNRLTV
uniref:Toxin La-alphaKTx3 n=1 Tax=Liocheles australasiae TaxID=431266 RepID=KAX63_LIOAU